jgi:site-specific recombinase XerC
MGTESLDLDLRLITVTGKGQHIRLLPIGDKTVKSWTATFASGWSIPTPTDHGCGWGDAAPWDRRESSRCSSDALGRQAFSLVNPHRFRHSFAHR